MEVESIRSDATEVFPVMTSVDKAWEFNVVPLSIESRLDASLDVRGAFLAVF
jgi:hypothetical protein